MTELAPELSEPDAHEAASRLRRTSTLAELALDDLAAGVAPSWWGQASEAYYASRGQVSGRLTALDSAATTLANAIDTYANDAGRAAARWRQAESDLDHARAHPSAAALTDPSMAGVDAAEAEAEMARAEREYRLAVAALSQAAQRTCQALDDVRDVEDHVQEAIDTFGQLMWVDSATAAISLGFGWTSDRDAWWDQVTGIVPGIVDQAAHPIQTAREVSGQQHFANGDWGKGIGTAAGAFSLRHMLRDADHADSATSADPPDGDVSEPDGDDANESNPPNAQHGSDALTLLPQTTDELIAGVDLQRQEVNPRAHTLQRHVNVDRQFIVTRYDEAVASAREGVTPTPMSRFFDRASAEEAITAAVREHELDVRALASNSQPKRLEIRMPLQEPAGEVVYRSQDGALRAVDGTMLVVRLRRNGNGHPYVLTSFLEGS